VKQSSGVQKLRCDCTTEHFIIANTGNSSSGQHGKEGPELFAGMLKQIGINLIEQEHLRMNALP
jgi:hypothetical protein